jgi:hypothetical protein
VRPCACLVRRVEQERLTLPKADGGDRDEGKWRSHVEVTDAEVARVARWIGARWIGPSPVGW